MLDRIARSEKDNALLAAEQAEEARRAGVADIRFRIAKGQVFPVELDVALAQGTIGAGQHARFLAKIGKQDEDRAGRIEGMVRVNDRLADGEKPDADDPADRAAVDANFDALSATIAERPPEDKAWIEDDYVAETGMLPAALRDSLIGGMFSEDAAAQVAAAGRLVAFEDSDPVLIVNLPAETPSPAPGRSPPTPIPASPPPASCNWRRRRWRSKERKGKIEKWNRSPRREPRNNRGPVVTGHRYPTPRGKRAPHVAVPAM